MNSVEVQESVRHNEGTNYLGKTMNLVLASICVLLLPMLATAIHGDDVQKELKALEGKWKAVSMEASGVPLPKENLPEFIFTVGAGGKSTAQSSHGTDQATITVDPKSNPRTIDNLHESGATKGKTQYGIYKLEGDKWTVCMTQPGVAASERPKDFATKGTGNVVFIFERQKAGK